MRVRVRIVASLVVLLSALLAFVMLYTPPNADPHQTSAPTTRTENAKQVTSPSNQSTQCSTKVQLCEVPQHMIYWRDLNEDCGVRSPLRCGGPNPKYVTFQPDGGGWNNIRMSMETAVIYAAATGRTLVLPREQYFYLLSKNSESHRNKMTFTSFYDITKLKDVMDVIPMKDFLQKEGHPQGCLKAVPPFMDRFFDVSNSEIFEWISKHSFVEKPHTDARVMGFPFNFSFASDPNACESEQAENLFSIGVQADARLKSFMLQRTYTPYEQTLHNHPVINFMGNFDDKYRLLTHFYTWMYFSDPKADRFYKRFARDRLRYKDEIWCAAAKIVALMRRKASGKGGNYASYHIRRGDFQYAETRVEISYILKHTRDLLQPQQVIYIATDEKDKRLFKPFTDAGFQVHFFKELAVEAGLGQKQDFLEDNAGPQQARPGASVLNMNHVGMIEQIVCANAQTFIGTPFSTFTGFITRMRGYYNDT